MGTRKHPDVETWVHICNQIIHHVLPSRSRTVHLLWVVTVPPLVLGGFFTVLVRVLIPNPQGWLGVAGCSAGVLLVARLRMWLKPVTGERSALSSPEPGSTPDDRGATPDDG